MAVRLLEGKDHATIYLYMEKNEFKLAVDVGCGPGQRRVHLAPCFTNVVGTDVSKAMVERAFVETIYLHCPAEELPFASGEVELLTAMMAAHWFDRPRVLQEANRVLRPGGCLPGSLTSLFIIATLTSSVIMKNCLNVSVNTVKVLDFNQKIQASLD
uniref:Methyltransferase type 11 domain-containing protein n=1 Tax=Fundulus heteroclitus TaxID=8078 RepID=A0A3Q2U7D8_FUNHE